MNIELGLGPLYNQMGNCLAKIDQPFIDKFGIDKTKLAVNNKDYVFLGWLIAAKAAYSSLSKSWTDFGKNVVFGDVGVNAAILPVLPVLPATPAIPPTGIRARFVSLAESIANNPNCTNDILVNLGLATAETPATKQTKEKPEVKVKMIAGRPNFTIKIGKHSGAQIYKDSGDGKGFAKFDKTTLSRYKDESPLPAPGTAVIWRYRFILIKGNTEVGDFSDVIEVTVTGI